MRQRGESGRGSIPYGICRNEWKVYDIFLMWVWWGFVGWGFVDG